MKKTSKEVELSWKPLLLINKEVKELIDYAHKTIGSTEWCGYVIYKESGSIQDQSLQLDIKNIFFLDIGEPSFTEYNADVSIFDMLDQHPELSEGEHKYGIIHTHHNMSCFFSGTDKEELLGNADKYPYYLSLIVNFDGNYCAKIAFAAEPEEKQIVYKSKWGNYKVKTLDNIIFTASCDIKVDTYVPNDFIVAKIIELKAKREAKNNITTNNLVTHNWKEEYANRIYDKNGNSPYNKNYIGFNQQSQLPFEESKNTPKNLKKAITLNNMEEFLKSYLLDGRDDHMKRSSRELLIDIATESTKSYSGNIEAWMEDNLDDIELFSRQYFKLNPNDSNDMAKYDESIIKVATLLKAYITTKYDNTNIPTIDILVDYLDTFITGYKEMIATTFSYNNGH